MGPPVSQHSLLNNHSVSHQKQKEWLKRKKQEEERGKYAYLKFSLFYNVSTDNFEENTTTICFSFFLLTTFFLFGFKLFLIGKKSIFASSPHSEEEEEQWKTRSVVM